MHETMNEVSGTPATPLLCNFVFASYKSSARIKKAEIVFEFQPKTSNNVGPLISTIMSKGTNHMSDTEEKVTSNPSMEGSLSANIAGVDLGSQNIS